MVAKRFTIAGGYNPNAGEPNNALNSLGWLASYGFSGYHYVWPSAGNVLAAEAAAIRRAGLDPVLNPFNDGGYAPGTSGSSLNGWASQLPGAGWSGVGGEGVSGSIVAVCQQYVPYISYAGWGCPDQCNLYVAPYSHPASGTKYGHCDITETYNQGDVIGANGTTASVSVNAAKSYNSKCVGILIGAWLINAGAQPYINIISSIESQGVTVKEILLWRGYDGYDPAGVVQSSSTIKDLMNHYGVVKSTVAQAMGSSSGGGGGTAGEKITIAASPTNPAMSVSVALTGNAKYGSTPATTSEKMTFMYSTDKKNWHGFATVAINKSGDFSTKIGAINGKAGTYYFVAKSSKTSLDSNIVTVKWSTSGTTTASAASTTFTSAVNSQKSSETPYTEYQGSPAIVSPQSGELDVYVCGEDGELWTLEYINNAWGTYQKVGGVLSIPNWPGAAYWGLTNDVMRTDIVVGGTNGDVYHIFGNQSGWSAWENLGGQVTGQLACVVPTAGQLWVFVRGTNGDLYYKYWNGSAWSKWESLGGQILAGTGVSACTWGGGRIDVFVTGTNKHLYQKYNTGSSWSDWHDLGGLLTSTPAAATLGTNNLGVFGRGTNGGMYVRDWNGTTWLPWKLIGGGLMANTGPGVTVMNGVYHVVVTGTNGNMWWIQGTPNNWSNWTNVTGNEPSAAATVTTPAATTFNPQAISPAPPTNISPGLAVMLLDHKQHN